MKDLLEEMVCNTCLLPTEHKAAASVLRVLTTHDESTTTIVELEQLLMHPLVSQPSFNISPFGLYVSQGAGSNHVCQCFLSSAISVVIWFLAISSFTRPRHLSFGLPRFRFPSSVICNIFLVASSLSRLCTCPNHLNLFSPRNSAIGYMCETCFNIGYFNSPSFSLYLSPKFNWS